MFTGIVEEIGIVIGANKTRSGVCLKIKTRTIHSDAKLGDSIAINGVCLSVTDVKNNFLSFDVIQETLRRTTIGELKVNDLVNLERSLRLDSRICGHFVSGHIDYKGKIALISRAAKETCFKISLPDEFAKFVAEKGSIALDGVSLTVVDVTRDAFSVYLIPHTLKNTTLDKKKKGDSVNVEVDLVARYLAKQTQKTDLKDTLKKYNYI